MKRLATLFLLLPFFVSGQNQANNWFFGDHAGLEFDGDNVMISMEGQTFPVGCPACHSEGTSAMSDSNGELLLYTNGEIIWNSQHEIMPNGDGILGSASSTQSSLILPLPGSNELFYVFTTDAFYNSDMENGFRYSVVDICKNNGLGVVIPDHKNTLLLEFASEKLTAVKHANDEDYWVITQKYYTNAFFAFHLSSDGIVDTTISHIGSVHPAGSEELAASIGQLKASPNGEKIAIVNGNCNPCIAEYFDFNTSDGSVTNPVNIQVEENYHHYGVSFSPDNSKLYLASYLNGNGIYQYDLMAGGGNPDSVIQSRTLIVGPYTTNFLGLQLAPDGRIYVSHAPFIGNTELSVIQYPNEPGEDCGYIHESISLGGATTSYGLPNFLDSFNYSNGVPNCSTTGVMENSSENSLEIVPNPVSSSTTIKLPKGLTQGRIRLFNSLGQLLRDTKIFANEPLNFDLGELSQGVYLIQLYDENQLTETARIIVPN